MRRHLEISDLGDLVDLSLVAVLCTYKADGSVLLSPVWHEYSGGGFNVCTSESDVKARHLRRDPRAVLVLAESNPPYRGVELTAEARFVHDGVPKTIRDIAIRYLGVAAGSAYTETATDDVILRLEPGIVRAWDFSDSQSG